MSISKGDDVTWNKGRHTIGFGGELFFLHNHYATNSNSFPSYALTRGMRTS